MLWLALAEYAWKAHMRFLQGVGFDVIQVSGTGYLETGTGTDSGYLETK